METVEFTTVDITDGQEPDRDRQEFDALNMSGQDRASCERAGLYADSYVNEYPLANDSRPRADVPRGDFFRFRWTGATYPAAPRNVWLYIPVHARTAQSVHLLVCNDGPWYFGPRVNATYALDNLIHAGEIPPTVGLFIGPGEQGPGIPIWGGSDNRSIEYDTVDPTYANFMVDELLPVVARQVNLSSDPRARVVCGFSSGGAAAVSAAYFRPDQFGNVISHCGSFLSQRGGHEIPSIIRRTPRRNVRIWAQSGARDLNIVFGDIATVNHELASSLAYRRYDFRFEFGTGGHTLDHGGWQFPETLRWIWRDAAGVTNPY